MSRKPCGTTAAYQRHLRNGEEPCAECRRAWRKYHAEHRAKNPDRREREYAYNAAYDRALPSTRRRLLRGIQRSTCGGACQVMTYCDTCRPCDLCARELCEIHGEVDAAPTCGTHQECVDCVVTNPCRECAAVRRAA